MSLSKDFVELIKKTQEIKTSPYDTQAEVVRIEGQTAWVHIPGGVDETPVRMTINANPGDTVQVRVANGTAFLVGNGSAPPTDDHKANIASAQAMRAQATADEAKAGLNGVVNYFWHDGEGAHVSTAPGDASTSGVKNVLIDADGMNIRSGTVLLAYFHGDSIRLGPRLGHLDITPSSFIFSPKSGPANFVYRGVSGAEISQTYRGDGVTRTFTVFRSTATPTVTIDGTATTAFSTRYNSNESIGSLIFTTAPADGAVITITYTTSWENPEFRFGVNRTGGPYAFAEGYGVTASGILSHAEGSDSVASGPYAHAQNRGTNAAGAAQTAIGKYNVEDTANEYALIIGNGTGGSARSNALAVTWDGDILLADDADISAALTTLGW